MKIDLPEKPPIRRFFFFENICIFMIFSQFTPQLSENFIFFIYKPGIIWYNKKKKIGRDHYDL